MTVARKLLILLIGLMVPSLAVFAQQPGDSVSVQNLHWLADSEGQYPDLPALWAETEELAWQPAPDGSLNAGFEPTPHWFRFEAGPAEDDDALTRYLHVPDPLLNNLVIHVVREGEVLAHHRLGTDYPFSERPVAHRAFVVPVELSVTGPTEFYARVQTNGSLQFEPRFWEPAAFAEYSRNEAIAWGLFYGIMLVMVLYNLFVYSMVRDPSYLHYIAFVAVFALFIGALQGDAFQYLWPESVAWNEISVAFMVALLGVVSLSFTTSFLKLKKRWMLMHRVILGLIGVSVLLTLLSMLVGYQLSIRLTSIHGLLIMAVILFTGSVMLIRGHRYARYFVLAWVAVLIGTAALSLSKWGLLPWNLITANGAQIGVVLEVILLSFALGDRINFERAARFEAQREALEAAEQAKSAQQELIEAKEEANRELEDRVRERTRKLEDTLAQLERMNRYLEDISRTDQLTGLSNRHCIVRSFHEEYRRAHRQQYPISVVMMDIDHFKWFNDTFGHVAGDECLKAVAQALAGEVTRAGDMIARYGGEEFIVLLGNTDADGAAIVAERLREAVAGLELVFEGQHVKVTVSLGVADEVPQDLTDPENLILRADEALYAAKGMGRNCVCRHWKGSSSTQTHS